MCKSFRETRDQRVVCNDAWQLEVYKLILWLEGADSFCSTCIFDEWVALEEVPCIMND